MAPVILEGISRALPCLRQHRLSVKLKSLSKSDALEHAKGMVRGLWEEFQGHLGMKEDVR